MNIRLKLQHAFGGGVPARRWIAGVVGRAGFARIVSLCGLQSLMALNAVGFALAMRQTIDAAVTGSANGFWLWCGVFAGIPCVQVACIAANRALLERTLSCFENQLRSRAFADVLAQPYERVQHRHSGELITRMTSDVSVVADGASTLIPTMVSMTVRLVGVVAALFALVPGLTLVFVIGGCIAASASLAVRPLLKRLHTGMQEAEGSMRSYLQECLDSLLVVHAFGCERKVRERAEDAMSAHRRARLRKADVSNGCSTALVLAVQAGYVLGFGWCGFGILNGTCTYGTLMAVVQLIGQVQLPFSSLGGSFSKYSSMLASSERLMGLNRDLDDKQSAKTSQNGVDAAERTIAANAAEGDGVNARSSESGVSDPDAEMQVNAAMKANMSAEDGIGDDVVFESASFSKLELRGVSFAYDRGDDVLHDCDFALNAGEFVGLAGPSGVGKSTLTKLLLGAYMPRSGEAWAQGAGGMRVPLCKAKGLFALVPQGNRLMAGTICDTVAFAEQGDSPDLQRVVVACKAACAWDFIRALPQGLDTPLGQRGTGLSEGQVQRLAVARAVYSQAPVLLLDEATSALDAETEREMLANLRALPGRAAVLVTHREATLAVCDRVVEICGGSCAEQ